MIKILYLLTSPISIGPLGTDYRAQNYYHCILYIACYHILLGYQSQCSYLLARSSGVQNTMRHVP